MENERQGLGTVLRDITRLQLCSQHPIMASYGPHIGDREDPPEGLTPLYLRLLLILWVRHRAAGRGFRDALTEIRVKVKR